MSQAHSTPAVSVWSSTSSNSWCRLLTRVAYTCSWTPHQSAMPVVAAAKRGRFQQRHHVQSPLTMHQFSANRLETTAPTVATQTELTFPPNFNVWDIFGKLGMHCYELDASRLL